MKKTPTSEVPNKISYGFTKIYSVGTRKSFIVTIPKEVREVFDIKGGDRIEWVINFDKKIIELIVWPKASGIIFDETTNKWTNSVPKAPLKDKFTKALQEAKKEIVAEA